MKLNSPLLKMIWKRLHHENKNFLVLVLGETGSSKSYSSIRICELVEAYLHPTFSTKNVIMSFLAFMNRLTDKGDNRAPKGSALVYEELGISGDADEWWSKTNKILKYILQTFRTRNLAVFFTVPDEILVDNRIKSMFHAVMEMQYIDYSKRIAWFKMYRIQRRPKRSSKQVSTYYKQYQFYEKDGEGRWTPFKYSLIGVHEPSPWLVKWYEKAREKMSDQLEAEMFDWATKNKYVKMGMKMSKKQKRNLRKKEMEMEVQQLEETAQHIVTALPHYTDERGKLLTMKIRKEYGIGMNRMSELRQMVRELRLAQEK